MAKSLGHSLPLSEPSPLCLETSEDLISKALVHRITPSNETGFNQNIKLYSSSFCPFSPSEPQSSKQLLFGSNDTFVPINVPTPPATYASLIRMAAMYKRNDATRKLLLCELAQLTLYYLYGGQYGEAEEEQDEETIQEDIRKAIAIVYGWSWNAGEEWIGDALAEVVVTAAYTFLPWMG